MKSLVLFAILLLFGVSAFFLMRSETSGSNAVGLSGLQESEDPSQEFAASDLPRLPESKGTLGESARHAATPPVSAPESWTVRGQLVVPAGMPAEERLTLSAESSDAVPIVVDLNADHSFQLSVPVDVERVELVLQARYCFFENKVNLRRPADTEAPVAVRLAPMLGGLLSVELQGTTQLQEIDAKRYAITLQASPGMPGLRTDVVVTGPASFECRAVPTEVIFTLAIQGGSTVPVQLHGLRCFRGKQLAVQAALTEGASFVGTVQLEDGRPAPGATLALLCNRTGEIGIRGWRVSSEVKSDESGHFEFEGVAAGEYRLRTSFEGCVKSEMKLGHCESGESRADLLVELASGKSIAGLVHWPDGRPADNATVRLHPEARVWITEATAQTTADGGFQFEGLEAGAYLIVAEGSEDGGAAGGARQDNVVAGASDLALVLEPGDYVSGRLTDDRGAAIQRFQIIAEPVKASGANDLRETRRERFKQAQGLFKLEGLQPGAWDIQAEAKGHAKAKVVRVFLPDRGGELSFVLARTASIRGFVVDPSGQPLEGAQVTAGTTGAPLERATSDGDGEFYLKEVMPGEVLLMANAEGVRSAERNKIVLAPGEELEGVQVAMRVGATLQGQVHASIVDFAGRKILMSPVGEFTQVATLCDDTGAFRFEGLEPGRWIVLFDWQPTGGGGADWIEGYQRRHETEVELLAGKTTHLILGAPDPNEVTLSGRVTRDGEGCGSYLIYVNPPPQMEALGTSMPIQITRTDAAGHYRTTLKHGGTYRFSGGPDVRDQVRFIRTIAGSREAELNFELASLVLRGKVLNAEGEPLAKQALMLVHSDVGPHSRAMGDQHTGATDAKGEFAFKDISPGDYLLRLGGWGTKNLGAGVRVVDNIHVQSDQAPDALLIEAAPPCVIEGQVLDHAGLPAAGARLQVYDAAGYPLYIWNFPTTDHMGEFRLGDLGPGPLTFEAKLEDGSTVSAECLAAPDSVCRVVLRP